jgi:hypothetical protein
MLDLWSSHWTVFVEIGPSRWIFSSAVTCAAIFWNNPFRCMTISFCQWFSLTVPLHWCLLMIHVCQHNFRIVTRDTPNNVTVSVTDASAKCIPMICPLSKSDKSPMLWFFHRDSLNTFANALTWALQSVNKWKKRIQWCQLKFCQYSQHKQILFLNFLVLFCPPPDCSITTVLKRILFLTECQKERQVKQDKKVEVVTIQWGIQDVISNKNKHKISSTWVWNFKSYINHRLMKFQDQESSVFEYTAKNNVKKICHFHNGPWTDCKCQTRCKIRTVISQRGRSVICFPVCKGNCILIPEIRKKMCW